MNETIILFKEESVYLFYFGHLKFINGHIKDIDIL